MPAATQDSRRSWGLFADKPVPRLYDRIVEVSRVITHLRGDKWLIAMLLYGGGLLADGYDIRTVQELLGRQDVRTTMIYTHVLNRGGRGVRSPADGLVRDPGER